jgi:16S rRNA (uracil1498-N3)-methyltransferase
MIPRCFVDPADWDAERIRLTPADAHHVTAVLRAGVGAEVAVCDGRGGEAAASIVEAGPDGVVVQVRARRRSGTADWRLTLVQAVPKGERMEWIIQKAVELGAWSVVPVMTDRGVVRLEGARAVQRVERWQRIATEAAKQCRTAWITRVEPVVSLGRWLESPGRPGTLVIGSLEAEARPFRAVCAELRAGTPGGAALLIGPEGDFSPDELQQARAAGACPVTFGRRVLRVETAAIYALSVMAYELDVMAAAE